MVSLLSLWIDWAIVNCQPGSCELPLTVINGSILWLWETDQYVHEWQNESTFTSISTFKITPNSQKRIGYVFIQRDGIKMYECLFLLWTVLQWHDNQAKAFRKASEAGDNNKNNCKTNAASCKNTKHLQITKTLKQYFSVVGKRLNIMSFTIKVLQAYCIALHYLFPLPLVLIPCFQAGSYSQ